MVDQRRSGPGQVRRVTGQITINASSQRVWSILTDIHRMPGLHPHMLSARWLDDRSEAALGAWFRSVNAYGDRRWESLSRIVEFRPGRAIAWTVESSQAPPAVCRFELIPDPEPGGERTTLRQTQVFDLRAGALPPVEQAVAG